MNYIELINKAWNLREQGMISPRDHDLYAYLVHKSNTLHWQNPFNQSSDVICAMLGMSTNTLMARRKRLQEVGLIRFSIGTSALYPAQYELCVTRKRNYKKANAQKPTLEEVVAYCTEQQNGVDAAKFYAFYEEKNWCAGTSKIKKWKSIVDIWKKNNDQRKHSFAKHTNGIDYGNF